MEADGIPGTPEVLWGPGLRRLAINGVEACLVAHFAAGRPPGARGLSGMPSERTA